MAGEKTGKHALVRLAKASSITSLLILSHLVEVVKVVVVVVDVRGCRIRMTQYTGRKSLVSYHDLVVRLVKRQNLEEVVALGVVGPLSSSCGRRP